MEIPNLSSRGLELMDPASTNPSGLPAEGPAPNPEVAWCLEETGSLLEQQQASPFRVRAYRNAAAAVRTLPVSVVALYQDGGLEELERIPSVGPGIARAIRELVLTGRLPMLQRLRGESDPVLLFSTVPGVGPRLAERLHQELGLATLEDLEVAAHDGRLDALHHRLGRVDGRSPMRSAPPSVGELLSVDEEYRESAEAGRLPRIAPRRFNPEGRQWLPILHTVRGPRHYTALFSNTAQAHRLRRTHDWVVIYGDGEREEHQATVVTARIGPLSGRRVVRGREPECLKLYQLHSRASEPMPKGVVL